MRSSNCALIRYVWLLCLFKSDRALEPQAIKLCRKYGAVRETGSCSDGTYIQAKWLWRQEAKMCQSRSFHGSLRVIWLKNYWTSEGKKKCLYEFSLKNSRLMFLSDAGCRTVPDWHWGDLVFVVPAKLCAHSNTHHLSGLLIPHFETWSSWRYTSVLRTWWLGKASYV